MLQRLRALPARSLLSAALALSLLAAAAAFMRTTTATGARAAALFVVNSTGDGGDANPADGLCDDGTGNCTLRAAIEQSNHSPANPNTINFGIGTGVQTIIISSRLPEINSRVVVDGTTQPGFAGQPIVELTAGGSSPDGLALRGGNSVVRGLVINRLGAAISLLSSGNVVEGNYLGTEVNGNEGDGNIVGVTIFAPGNRIGGTTPAARNVISGNGGGISFAAGANDPPLLPPNVIQGNYIGTNAAGTAALRNFNTGVRNASGAIIGGDAPGAGNVISGNLFDGIHLFSHNVVQGNFIGTDATGTRPAANGTRGINVVSGRANLIGGTTPGARNVISGNGVVGISLGDNATDNLVQGNFIGTDATGTRPVPNGGSPAAGGIGISGRGNHIGGHLPGEGNVIAYNGGPGVGIGSSGNPTSVFENRVRGNSIFANNGVGIELLPGAGVTPNDAGDPDAGGNTAQNFPVVTAATTDGETTTVRGALNSTPSTNFELDFFSNSGCDPLGNGEGARYLGSRSVTTDAGGDTVFLVTLHGALPPGRVVTATATAFGGNTSEFSPCGGGPAAGLVRFGEFTASLTDDLGALVVPLVRVGGSAGTLSVVFTTASILDLSPTETAMPGADYTHVEQVVTFGPGETFKQVTVPIIDDQVAEWFNGERFLITLSSPDAPDVLVDSSQRLVLLRDPNFRAGVISYDSARVTEGDSGTTPLVVTVRLSTAVSHTVTVEYETVAPFTALAGVDYLPVSGTITFPPGSTTQTVTVPVVGDRFNDDGEAFALRLKNPSGAFVTPSFPPSPPFLIIVDDDLPITVTVTDAGVVEPASGTADAVFTVTLSAPAEQNVFVSYTTADGTAAAGSDYQSANTFVVFSPGETTRTITIPVNADALDEPVERFLLRLSSSFATLPDNTAVGTIGQPGSPTVEFSQSVYTAGEASHVFNVTVTRAGDTSGTSSVNYSTLDGSASERGDYTTALGTLRFAPGETSKTIPLLLTEDAFAEGAETLRLLLTDAEGAMLGARNAAELTLTNDPPPVPGNPIDDARVFVRQHYHDFLNREPDEAGLQFWTNQITQCGADAACVERQRELVSAAFFLSIEFQNTGYQVIRIYKASLPPDAARPRGLPRYREFLRDTQEIGRGVVVGVGDWEQRLRENTQEFARRWVASAEFVQQFPATLTAAEFVDKLFLNSQVFQPTQAERDAALAAFGAGGIEGRAAALLSVTNSGSVYNRQYNPAFVLMQYISYLRRNPSDAPDANFAGYDFWLTKLNSFSQPPGDARDESVALERVRQAEMIRAFINSIEYRRRFGN